MKMKLLVLNKLKQVLHKQFIDLLIMEKYTIQLMGGELQKKVCGN